MAGIHRLLELARRERRDNWAGLLGTLERHGELPEQHGLRSPRLRGISTGKREKRAGVPEAAELPEGQKTEKAPAYDIGAWQKELAEMEYDPLDHYA